MDNDQGEDFEKYEETYADKGFNEIPLESENNQENE